MLIRLPWLIVAFGLAGFTAKAELIQWFSDAVRVNLDSQNLPMDAGYTFELGVFSGGFVPTRANISEWRTRWVAADTAAYEVTNQRFAGAHTVSHNAAPFLAGTSAWIFGHRDTAVGSEWILFRNTSWLWPAASSGPPFPDEDSGWNVKDANQVVFGQLNQGFLMKSESLQTYGQWQTAYLTGEPLNAPNDDPDQDGVSNVLEFVFGTLPKAPNPPTATPSTLVAGNMQMSVPRRTDRLANLVIEVSANLIHWNSGASHTEIISNDASVLVVRDLTPIDAAHPRRFMRLRVTLP
jgi:hypothetical protein